MFKLKLKREKNFKKNEQMKLPEDVDAAFMDILNDDTNEHDKSFKGLVKS